MDISVFNMLHLLRTFKNSEHLYSWSKTNKNIIRNTNLHKFDTLWWEAFPRSKYEAGIYMKWFIFLNASILLSKQVAGILTEMHRPNCTQTTSVITGQAEKIFFIGPEILANNQKPRAPPWTINLRVTG